MVFTVESALADELKKPADDFRLKDLFDARSFNTTRVEIARGGQTIAFEKEGQPRGPSLKETGSRSRPRRRTPTPPRSTRC